MSYPSDRKSPTRLSADEKYAIYKYCVENHALKQVEDMTTFWAEPHKVAKEINLLKFEWMNGKEISSQHVKDSVEYTVAWQRRLDKLPVPPENTVELEQLKETKIKLVKENEELKLSIRSQIDVINDQQKEIERLKKPSDAQNKLARIRSIVSA